MNHHPEPLPLGNGIVTCRSGSIMPRDGANGPQRARGID